MINFNVSKGGETEKKILNKGEKWSQNMGAKLLVFGHEASKKNIVFLGIKIREKSLFDEI